MYNPAVRLLQRTLEFVLSQILPQRDVLKDSASPTDTEPFSKWFQIFVDTPNQPLYTVNLFPFPKTWPASHLFQDENRPFFGICAQLMLHEKVGPPEATRWNKLPVLIVIRWMD